MDSIIETDGPITQAAPATGLLDIHCHLLPGIDDGCQLVAESLECIRLLKDTGFVGSICTPHFLPAVYPDLLPQFIHRHVADLQMELDRAGIEYQLWPGAEIRLHEETISWLERFGVPTLADSQLVLVDYFGRDWPSFADRTIQWLQDRGYQPILAHPERMKLDPVELGRLADRMDQLGVLLQGNLASVGGGEGDVSRLVSKSWLSEKRYAFLASDLHRPAHWPERRCGLEWAWSVDPAQTQQLMQANVLANMGLTLGRHRNPSPKW